MYIFSTIAGIALVVTVLWEVFETIVLPRRVTRQFRLTRLFYRSTWIPWTAIAGLRRNKKKRDSLLSFYGPLSLLLLLVFWAVTLILGFAFIHYGVSQFAGPLPSGRFGTALYMSGTTLFTLGLGDVTPATTLARVITVVEAGIGFGFLALVIGYLPVLYQSFSRREVTISLLDARAGTPPTAYELLRRHTGAEGFDALTEVLKDWERWAAELMESHLSYPALAYFRSQHDNQSWLGSLVAVLDSCALAMVGLEGMCQYQARMTFAIARHALVDLSQVFSAAPAADAVPVRMSAEQLAELRRRLDQLGIRLSDHEGADGHLEELRRLYEPFAFSLARYLRIDLPPWFKSDPAKDNWQTSAWQPKQTECRAVASVDEHF
jgi:Ion channel